MNRFIFSSESVSDGHPDKVCDQISDAVLDEILRKDAAKEKARVACETFITMGLVIVGGEITTDAFVDVHKIVRGLLEDIGYNHPKYGFDFNTCAILNAIHTQSPDIALGVDTGGAGDQGVMFGYACDETKELMPLPIMLAHQLMLKQKEARQKKILPFIGPDGKSQVSVVYEDDKPKYVETVIFSTQHTEEVIDPKTDKISEDARQQIIEKIIRPTLGNWIDKNTKYLINPTGRFVIGGPQSDTGMTGRKIIVDTYGGMAPHGGGAFSGKDPTKVDRSATYMVRHIAKNIVAAGLARKCLVQVAYAIGVAEPVSVMVNTYGTGQVSDERLTSVIRKLFDLTPRGIIKYLNLLQPIYEKTAAYGHFGRQDAGFPWEQTDRTDELLKAVK